MFGLDRYKDALGIPRVGFHSMRIPILDYALRDIIGTVVITWILVMIFAKDKSIKNSIYWIIFAFLLGILLHLLFGVRTKMIGDIKKFLNV